ncbi:MAG: 4a-hydroxytetrahydrobiopterin dehydratase [Planctomycetota bacterium]
MNLPTASELKAKKCLPCEGGVEPFSLEKSQKQLEQLPKWVISEDGKWISRKWMMKNFVEALEFINKVGQIAEDDAHHPDIHLTGYRQLKIEISTHAISGLSENDFILAAKIDAAAEA